MNGMQREIEGSVFIFPMILRIRTVRPERLNWLNSVMPRQISVQLIVKEQLLKVVRKKIREKKGLKNFVQKQEF